jgi:hypothetical protein
MMMVKLLYGAKMEEDEAIVRALLGDALVEALQGAGEGMVWLRDATLYEIQIKAYVVCTPVSLAEVFEAHDWYIDYMQANYGQMVGVDAGMLTSFDLPADLGSKGEGVISHTRTPELERAMHLIHEKNKEDAQSFLDGRKSDHKVELTFNDVDLDFSHLIGQPLHDVVMELEVMVKRMDKKQVGQVADGDGDTEQTTDIIRLMEREYASYMEAHNKHVETAKNAKNYWHMKSSVDLAQEAVQRAKAIHDLLHAINKADRK